MATLWTPEPGAVGFDTSARLSASQAQQAAAAGYRFAMRYATIPGQTQQPQPLTPDEAAALRAAGIAIGIVQMFQTPSQISPANGYRDGASAAQQAAALGYPPGAVLWCDLEGVFPSAADLISYLNNWGATVQKAGYPAGLYNGPQSPLTGAQIQALIFPHYWKAAANVPTPSRGYQVIQMSPANMTAFGTAIDVDITRRDNRGDLPTFWASSV